jgi:membrane protein
MSGKKRVTERMATARDRWPVLDHAVRTQQHYSRVNAGAQAGAVTYFAFLSFFPLLALAFFVVGYIARYFPRAQDNLVEGIGQVLPGMIGPARGQISLDDIERAAATVGIIGLVTLVYSGLGWLSGMRNALGVVFELPRSVRPNFVIGKLRDLVALVVVGSILLVSVGLSGVVTRFSTELLDLLDLDHDLAGAVEAMAVVVGLAGNTLFFFTLFKLLARPPVPNRSLWQGALLGSVAFEVLKQLSTFLLAATHRSPAFQAFGIALILVVWINYFARLVMYAAAWACTTEAARLQQRLAVQSPPVDAPARGPRMTAPLSGVRDGRRLDPRLSFAAGAALTVGLLALVRRRRH